MVSDILWLTYTFGNDADIKLPWASHPPDTSWQQDLYWKLASVIQIIASIKKIQRFWARRLAVLRHYENELGAWVNNHGSNYLTLNSTLPWSNLFNSLAPNLWTKYKYSPNSFDKIKGRTIKPGYKQTREKWEELIEKHELQMDIIIQHSFTMRIEKNELTFLTLFNAHQLLPSLAHLLEYLIQSQLSKDYHTKYAFLSLQTLECNQHSINYLTGYVWNGILSMVQQA